MRDMSLVRWFPDEDRAKDLAKTLLEAGLGADVGEASEPVDPSIEPEAGTSDDSPEAVPWPVAPLSPNPPLAPAPPGPAAGLAGFGVYVLDNDLARARELLGIEAPAGETDGDDAKAKKASWKFILLIWLIAMLTIPTAFFLGTYYVLSR